jgi:hypothetical protein
MATFSDRPGRDDTSADKLIARAAADAVPELQ